MTKDEFMQYVSDRLSERSTWQGIGFVLGAVGCKWAGEVDWGAAAAFGGFISAGLKVVFADKK